MKHPNDRYAKVYSHKGYDICILKVTIPTNGDSRNYVIDSAEFENQEFEDPMDAIAAIDDFLKKIEGKGGN